MTISQPQTPSPPKRSLGTLYSQAEIGLQQSPQTITLGTLYAESSLAPVDPWPNAPTPAIRPENSLGAAWKQSQSPDVAHPQAVDLPLSDIPRPPASTKKIALPDPTHAKSDSLTGPSIGRSSLIMATGTLISRVLGLLRTILQVAAIGGTTRVVNIWDTANTLPNIIYLLLAGGVINAVLVPQVTRALHHADGGRNYLNRLLTLAMTLLLAVTIGFMLIAPWLYKAFDTGATGIRLELGTIFTLITLPQIFFYGLYTLYAQILNAHNRFAGFTWSPILANVFAIFGLVWFLFKYPTDASPAAWTTEMIWVLGGSATAGIIAQALALIPILRSTGYRYRPNFTFRGVGLRSTSVMAGWAFGSVILQQIGLLVTSNVLNAQPEGAPGRYAQSTAFLLFMLPHSLITVSLVTALFTRMSTNAEAGEHQAVISDVHEGLRLSGLASIFMTFASFFLIVPLVTVLYGSRGPGDIWAFSSTTVAMMTGLVFFSINLTVQRAFYAYEDARTPFFMQISTTVVAIIATLATYFWVSPLWVGVGVGLAQTVSNAVQSYLGLRWLRNRTGPFSMKPVWNAYARLAVAALLATMLGASLRISLEAWQGAVFVRSVSGSLWLLAIGGALVVGAYVFIARWLGVPEITAAWRAISRRLRRSSA